MRKVYKLDGEICANCAGKIQDAISKLDGVNHVSVNAMTLKFTLDAQDGAFAGALDESLKAFARIEPDCEVLV